MLFPVHDEIIAECPFENRQRCGELMSQLMIQSGAGTISELAVGVGMGKNGQEQRESQMESIANVKTCGVKDDEFTGSPM